MCLSAFSDICPQEDLSMILPILSYGHAILRRKCDAIAADDPAVQSLIDDLWETMQGANGCGLAAPQIGRAIRLFIVDSATTYELFDADDRTAFFVAGDKGIKETFINAQIIERSADYWEDEEGCLSIPGLTQTVRRSWEITISYFDRDFVEHTKTFSGLTARMIQHEYDHTEGVLYLDHLQPLKRKMLESKLRRIAKGLLPATYPMKYMK